MFHRTRRLLLCLLALVLASEASIGAAIAPFTPMHDDAMTGANCVPAMVAFAAGDTTVSETPQAAPEGSEHSPHAQRHGHHGCPHLGQTAISAAMTCWALVQGELGAIAAPTVALVTRSVDPPLHPPRAA